LFAADDPQSAAALLHSTFPQYRHSRDVMYLYIFAHFNSFTPRSPNQISVPF
jgi:hypothetical protein